LPQVLAQQLVAVFATNMEFHAAAREIDAQERNGRKRTRLNFEFNDLSVDEDSMKETKSCCDSTQSSMQSPKENLVFSRQETAGYSGCALERLLESTPIEVMASIKRLINRLEHERDSQILRMKEIKSICNKAMALEPNSDEKAPSCWTDIHSGMIDDDCNAILIAGFHPQSQYRSSIHFNQAMVDLVGLPQHEARRLFVELGPCIPMPKQDCLYSLVDNVLNQSEQQLERYFRLCCSTHEPYQARLVAGVQLKSFDSVGQVVQVYFRHDAMTL
jgi:hypothetical protein